MCTIIHKKGKIDLIQNQFPPIDFFFILRKLPKDETFISFANDYFDIGLLFCLFLRFANRVL